MDGEETIKCQFQSIIFINSGIFYRITTIVNVPVHLNDLTFNSVTFKDTHRKSAPSNKTTALTNSTNTDIWVVGILNQLFIRGF